MSCEVAALSLQAHANYGTWSINFDSSGIFHFHFHNNPLKDLFVFSILKSGITIIIACLFLSLILVEKWKINTAN